MTRWRFAEFQYLQPGPPRQLHTVVVYLPDVWTIMPTLEEWEALCQQKATEAAPQPQEASGVRLDLMKMQGSWAWWHKPVTPTLGRWRQEDPEFKVDFRYMSPYLKSTCPDPRAQRVTPELLS